MGRGGEVKGSVYEGTSVRPCRQINNALPLVYDGKQSLHFVFQAPVAAATPILDKSLRVKLVRLNVPAVNEVEL